MENEILHHKHYITVDERGMVVDGFSDALRTPTASDICINQRGGYHFRLFPADENTPVLYDWQHMIPLYKYENGEIVKRTEEEIAADIAALPETEPTEDEKRDAQIFYTAMMTDTLLEEV